MSIIISVTTESISTDYNYTLIIGTWPDDVSF